MSADYPYALDGSEGWPQAEPDRQRPVSSPAVLHVNADVLHGAEQMRMLIHAEVLRKARDVEDGMSCATQDALLDVCECIIAIDYERDLEAVLDRWTAKQMTQADRAP